MKSKCWRTRRLALWTLLIWQMVVLPISTTSADDSSSSKPKLIGSGSAATEQREVEKFADISVSSAIKLDVNVGPEVAIAVTADDNILPHVITEVTGDRLRIYVDQNYKSKLGVKVNMAAPELRGLRGSGAVKTSVTNVSGERFRLGLSGASECKWKGQVEALAMKLDGGSKADVSGSATRLEANCAGAAKIDARNLVAKSGVLTLSGASAARVNVSDALNVTASGASSIKYAGQPTVEKNVSGASRVSAE